DIVVDSKKGPVTDPRHMAEIGRWEDQVAHDPGVGAVLGPDAIAARTRRARRAGHALGGLSRQLAQGSRGLDRLSSGLQRVDRGVGELQGGLAQAAGAAGRLERGGSTTLVATTGSAPAWPSAARAPQRSIPACATQA